MTPYARSLALAGILSFAACGLSLTPLDTFVTSADKGVRIDAESNAVDTFSFFFTNGTQAPVVLNSDNVVLRGPKGDKHRLMYGDAQYQIAPGAREHITLKFSTKDLDYGTKVQLVFDNAVTSNGQPISVPPMGYQTQTQ